MQDAGQQTSPAAAGDGAGHVFLSWQDDRNGNWDVYGALLEPELDVTIIEYDYDDLYRLIGASYTGAVSATFGYEYDPVRNLLTVTETITGTTVTGRVAGRGGARPEHVGPPRRSLYRARRR